MTKCNRIMLGRSGMYAEECLQGGYVGVDFDINRDLSMDLDASEEWKDFNKRMIPVYLEVRPEKTTTAAGLACGNLFTVCKGLKNGDIVLCPNGKGYYLVGEIAGDYYYVAGSNLPHRRPVSWYQKTIKRSDMSTGLQNSTGSILTSCDITKHIAEVVQLLGISENILESDDAAAEPKPIAKISLEVQPSQQNYTVDHYSVDGLLAAVKMGDIAIPEIQRPFVWEPEKVTKLMDSLYNGFPIGYIVTWQSPNVKLKDGSHSAGKKIIIDGQQRITALRAAILGETVKTKDYEDVRIKVAFNPVTRAFMTQNPAIEKNSIWIKDISTFLSGKEKISTLRREYCKQNPQFEEDEIEEVFDSLKELVKKEIGVIKLSGNLDIEKVTEIFIRINSEGVPLNQADFVMSTIAANETYGGNMLRKCIDHFSELAVRPEFYPTLIANDTDFAESPYHQMVAWLKNENDDIYDPTYVDILRVAFTYKFGRGKMSDLVSLLSGRSFIDRTYVESIKASTYEDLAEGVKQYINETNFKRFVMIIRSAGFCSSKLIRSQNTLNFAYILYLKLRELKYKPQDIEKYVRRWFVLSILTGRYSASPESSFDFDVKQITPERDFGEFLADTEAAELSDAFWDFGVVQQLNTSVASSPTFNVFLASQCFQHRKGFLSTGITVQDMIEQKGDVHHIFPRQFLVDNKVPKAMYNQVANYVYTQTEINIQIGKKAPNQYLGYVRDVQCQGGETMYGGITDINILNRNLTEDCCLPENLADMTLEDFPAFLETRRKLIAARLKEYYFSL